ncbi:MAG: HlyD family efflux transporter periplasmic adaptor subunit [Pseudomonadota bacterium]
MKLNMRIKKPSKKNQALLAITCVGLAATGTLMATAPSHDPNQVAERVFPVTTMAAETGELSPELRLFGRVETPHHAQLTAAVTAMVNSVNVREGQIVQKGDVLLALDDAEEELRYEQRQADVTEMRAALETLQHELKIDLQVFSHMQELHELTLAKRKRLEKLASQNLVATEQLEDTRANVARQAIQLAEQQLKVDNHPQRIAVAEAALARAESLLAEQELRLSRTVVAAPFRGRVSRIEAAPGDRVREGDILLEIYDTAALQVRVTLPSSAADAVKLAMANGESVVARLNDSGSQEIELEQLAAEVADGRSGVDGLFRVAESDLLEIGKAVDVTVIMPGVERVTGVPVQSLYGDDRVYTVVDGRLRGIQVDTVGRRVLQGGHVQLLVRPVRDALEGHILTTSLPQASTGLRVEVVNG